MSVKFNNTNTKRTKLFDVYVGFVPIIDNAFLNVSETAEPCCSSTSGIAVDARAPNHPPLDQQFNFCTLWQSIRQCQIAVNFTPANE